MPTSSLDRRDWHRKTLALGAAAAALGATTARSAVASPAATEPLLRPGDVVLFQGDSITDAGRDRNDLAANSAKAWGDGYMFLIGTQLRLRHADLGLQILNRGVGGDKVPQLTARWDADCLALKPNVVSILVGVNDYWHTKSYDYDGTVAEYEAGFRQLIARTRDALPEVRLILCEPFLLACGTVTKDWLAPFAEYRAAAARVAAEAGARFVSLQAMFDAATAIAPAERWAGDGVHPTAAGAALMAGEWLRVAGA